MIIMIGFNLSVSQLPGEISKLCLGDIVDKSARWEIRQSSGDSLEVTLPGNVEHGGAEEVFDGVLHILGNYGVDISRVELGTCQRSGFLWEESHIPFRIKEAYDKVKSSYLP